jgi:hypothetical protein
MGSDALLTKIGNCTPTGTEESLHCVYDAIRIEKLFYPFFLYVIFRWCRAWGGGGDVCSKAGNRYGLGRSASVSESTYFFRLDEQTGTLGKKSKK